MNHDPISPVQAATKLAACWTNPPKGFEDGPKSRLAELVWFIQAASAAPDGLKGLADALMAHAPKKFSEVGFGQWELDEGLYNFCTLKDCDHFAPSFCRDLRNVTFDYMDHFAGQFPDGLAKTALAAKVFDALDYAVTDRKFVRLDGPARLGKSESAKAWISRHPGRARFVTTPPGNSLEDFIRRIAEALGVPFAPYTGGTVLRRQVEYIVRHAQIGFVFDEAHHLFPSNYSKNTAPGRLNWTRSEIIDRGLPCVIITTPQSFDGDARRFVNFTQYNMDQFYGRVDRHVRLDNPDTSDLEAVARVHCGDFGKAEFDLVVKAAPIARSYVKAITDIASLARRHAKLRRRSAVEREDVIAAICEIIPDARRTDEKPGAPAPRRTGRPPRAVADEALNGARPGGRRINLPTEPATKGNPDCQRFDTDSLVAK